MAWVDGDFVSTTDAICAELERVAQHRPRTAFEAETECFAVQLVTRAARTLGASAADAGWPAHEAWREYPLMPAGYRTPLCRNGGPFDLRPRDPRWP